MKIKDFLIILGLLIFSGCLKNGDITQINSLDLSILNEAVLKYNDSRSLTQHEGLIIEGKVRVNDLEVEGKKFLEFMVSGKDIFREYEFQYEESQGIDRIPEDIEIGRVTFLGDNLIVEDLKKQQVFSFLVESFNSRIEGLTPIIGKGLGSTIFDTSEELSMAGGMCLCYCTNCMNCNHNCGSMAASCSCGRFNNSITCGSCLNAECGQCPSEQ